MIRRPAIVTAGGDAARALTRLLGLAMATAPLFAMQAQAGTVDCGDPIALELEPGLWSVTDAVVQDNTPIANGGPNLIKVRQCVDDDGVFRCRLRGQASELMMDRVSHISTLSLSLINYRMVTSRSARTE